MMEGKDIWEARQVLGELWGLDRNVTWEELGRALRLAGNDVAQSVRDYERGKTTISGPVSVCLDLFVAGVLPPDGLTEVLDNAEPKA
jgi:hypothetical protein